MVRRSIALGLAEHYRLYVLSLIVIAVGYNDVSRLFLVRNTWSAKWGIDC